MHRRTFIGVLAGGLVAAPLAAEAQQTATAPARIGFISTSDPKIWARELDAFRQGLRDRGWIEGRNLKSEYRWAEGNPDRLPGLASELVRLNVDVLVASGAPALRALQQATSTIPIVSAVLLIDPVGAGFVASLARPAGNITGLASQYEDIVTKQVQLLTEAVPKLSGARSPSTESPTLILLRHASASTVTDRAAAAAADKLGLKAKVVEISDVPQFEAAFRTARNAGAQAVLVLPSPIFNANRRLLIKLAATYSLPACYEFKEYVQDGGLMSYGPNIVDMCRRASSYVDRILHGAMPGDLPMERPSTFELIINLKTAKALGLTIPPSLLLRADEVIQ